MTTSICPLKENFVEEAPEWVLEGNYIWRHVPTGKFVYSDETEGFCDERYDTVEQATAALEAYCAFCLAPVKKMEVRISHCGPVSVIGAIQELVIEAGHLDDGVNEVIINIDTISAGLDAAKLVREAQEHFKHRYIRVGLGYVRDR